MRAALFAVVAMTGAAHADSQVSVSLNDLGQDLAANLGFSVPDFITHVESRIDELYKVSRIDQLLRAFADTTAFAQRANAVDYDIDPNDIVFGGAGGGVHGDVAIGTTNQLLGGSIITYGAMAGVNLGRWKQPRWTVFANGFYDTQTIRGLTGHLLTLGAHAQYQVIPAVARPHMRWTGIAATTGLEYARLTLGTTSTLTSHFTAQGPNERATVQMDSTGTLDVLTTTTTVPLEVSTGVRFGPLALYGGGGVTLTTGSSEINAELMSVLGINHDDVPIGTAVITGSGENTPSTFNAHALAGIAVHTRYVRVFLHGSFAPGETAASLGVRGAFQ